MQVGGLLANLCVKPFLGELPPIVECRFDAERDRSNSEHSDYRLDEVADN
jgi:hypothetical protein